MGDKELRRRRQYRMEERDHDDDNGGGMGGILFYGLLAGIAAAMVKQLPEIRRYLKMRGM
ncbi:MAG: DUF6893 family small protein [Longimicrobiaceae bacterium]